MSLALKSPYGERSIKYVLYCIVSRLKTYGDRAFSVVAPKLWNRLPPELRSVTSVDQFKAHLKTYLFKLAYDV